MGQAVKIERLSMNFKFFRTLSVLALTILDSTISSARQHPETIGEGLRRHNVQVTRAALVEALKSSNSEVRWLAARKLAEDKVTDAIPLIIEVLEKDRNLPRNRL